MHCPPQRLLEPRRAERIRRQKAVSDVRPNQDRLHTADRSGASERIADLRYAGAVWNAGRSGPVPTQGSALKGAGGNTYVRNGGVASGHLGDGSWRPLPDVVRAPRRTADNLPAEGRTTLCGHEVLCQRHGCIATTMRNPGEIWPQGSLERERAGGDAGGVLRGAP